MTTELKKNTKGKTYACIVLDTSTSMGAIREAAVEGYNEHVEAFWKWADDPEVDLYVSLVTFNTEVYEHLWNVPAKELKKSTYESFTPSGWTAFRDGVGYAIDKLMDTVNPGPDDAFLVIAITDGDENKSKHVSVDALKKKIKECESSGKWTITFMGCDKNSCLQLHRETGVAVANMAAWDTRTERGTRRAMRENVSKLNMYCDNRKKGLVSCDTYHNSVAGDLADYSMDLADSALPVASSVTYSADLNATPMNTVSVATGRVASAGPKVNPDGAVDVFSCTNKVSPDAYVRWKV